MAQQTEMGEGLTREHAKREWGHQRESESKIYHTQTMDTQRFRLGGANLEKDSPKSNSTLPNDGYPSGSAGICEKTEEYGKTVDCPTMGTIPNEELENQIAENIFDWWISGESYEKWYADKFLQQRIDFDEE